MARWRQVVDPETGKSEFVPIDAAARRQSGHFVHGDIDSFVSPIDGTVIEDRKQLDEHCKRHNVVPAEEFSAEHYERKAREREAHYTGKIDRQEQIQRRQMLYEAWMNEERKHGW